MERKGLSPLKVVVKNTANLQWMYEVLNEKKINTVCREASCPNIYECFEKKTASFLILGKSCTRNCKFCNVKKESPEPVDPEEPFKISEIVRELDLEYVVITSVTRDDLEDGGASHFAQTIKAIRKLSRRTIIEVLIPDFQGSIDSLKIVIEAKPDVISHNIETVSSLYKFARSMAIYERSLMLLKEIKRSNPEMITKSGIMLGLGEAFDELKKAFVDLGNVQCDILTIGQYLAPSKNHVEVKRYVTPSEFQAIREEALLAGIKSVVSEPLVRSSYKAKETYEALT